ncbi:MULTISPECIES: cysteine hydrolase family protein [Atlantibacter]|uniref:Peroxyureidoacrylate/ureidoacrylate amidohydrolase n=1 Tax=Atlantibacter hermannii NBRC 105704 TaxID=1115512 RepID=H5V1F4_ATLHE|nr:MULTISPECIES: cysteine hydrolase [Atlantibacter]MCQ4967230.1 cysteine hydrolase [Enterobacteriaceae bacterium DFI.7.85]HAP81986.1 cysteine hydrolase [Enterobacteriaceae bacterium]MDU1950250.1 cysteine hydrolase [Atlantibacter hermannii]MDU7813028.1 cysteine hydrolase [Atlantibacter hermannii]MDW4577021.1 cysteine hydrolase [Atlantibacter hermannii]
MKTLEAQPFAYSFDPATTALVMIDMQRDFVEPHGFGEALGNDVSLLRRAIEPCTRLLEAARQAGLLIVHTREGHRADLSNCPAAKLTRGGKTFIGQQGSMGRILIQGEPGHDIIPELYPLSGEPIIDKPGKGAFYATDLHLILQARGIKSLIICGVTTEVCVQTTAREANDRGYEVLIPEDCCASYFPEFHRAALEMIKAQGAIVGWVSDADAVINALR